MSLSKQDFEDLKTKLFEKRFLLIDNEINDKMVDEFIPKFFALCILKKEPINIIFDSGGGKVRNGLNLYDVIKSSPVEVTGYVIRECGSAALYPLVACKKRIGLPNSKYLFHSMRTTFTVKHNHGLSLSTQDQIDYWLKHGNDSSERSNKVFDSIGISKEKLEELDSYGEKHNHWISSEEALEIKLLTSIHDFSSNENWIWKNF